MKQEDYLTDGQAAQGRIKKRAKETARDVLRDDPAAVAIIGKYGAEMFWLGCEYTKRTQSEG